MTAPGSPSRRERRERTRRHLDGSLIFKVRIYLLVFVVVAVMAAVDAFRGSAGTWGFLALGLVAGTGVGVVASRMQRLDWNAFEHKVVGRFDTVGVVILVLYIAFAILRSRIVSAWVPAQYAAAAGLAVLAGAMFGQVIGIRRGVLDLRRRLLGRAEEPPPPSDGQG